MKYLPLSTPSRLCPARPRRGFTLVEILVVLAIIGILAAILFPAFASARASGRAAACASNLKQIGLGMLMYSQDHNGSLPLPPNNISSKGPRCGWPDLFFRYTRSAEVFLCPDDEEERPYDPACTATPDAPVEKAGSYTIVSTSYSLTRREPTKTILAIDGKGDRNAPGNTVNGKLIVLPEDIPKPFGEPRHLGGYNAVFGDGHVKRLTPDKMLDPLLWGWR